ncbi:MAG: ferrochelatase [Alphaproteobacteria bacterium]|nr:ferrochelatase [Alphaproteobacteria bacterium]
MTGAGKTAVVLFNLGGPDEPNAVQPFLFNLFNDPAIIGVPTPIRWLIATLISRRRAPVAQEIYEHLGGGSPLLANTQAQADALQASLGGEVRCFIAMRYWHPFADETAAEVKAFAPDRVVLLPLYPQFSTTTTGSSIKDWMRAAKAAGLEVPTKTICCYFDNTAFVDAIAARVRHMLDEFSEIRPRVLFTAHGLPKKIVAAGDPYQWQIEQTAAAIVTAIDRTGLDWITCYQSRVGPLEWIQPYTSDVLERAGADGVPVIVVPIGFTSEHSETLVELDIEYRELADKAGVPSYRRVDTVGADGNFIDGLASIVKHAVAQSEPLTSDESGCRCPEMHTRCMFRMR